MNGPGDMNMPDYTEMFKGTRRRMQREAKQRAKEEEEKKKKDAEKEARKRSFSLLTGYTPPNVARRTLLPGDMPFPLATV